MKLLASSWTDVVGVPENRSAVRAVRRLVRVFARPTRGGPPFSPLFLHGSPGTGKSTLVTAMVRAVSESPLGPTIQVIAANDIDPRPDDDDSHAELSTCDLLAIEDLQHLAERAADWLGRLLDERNARRRVTVFTANAGPASLRNLPRRLMSRVSAGLVVPLTALSPKSRLKLLSFHADRLKVRLTGEALHWLADQPVGGGFRPLLGMLNTLKTTSRGRATPLSREDASERLTNDEAKPTGIDAIIAAVAATFRVSEKDLLGASRLKTVMLARQTAMYLARVGTKLSLPAIGREFGRDHSTVLHTVRKVEAELAKDADLAGIVRELRTKLD